MSNHNKCVTAPDAWHSLQQFTPARIALGRAGMSLPTRACMDFQLAHALARDAVSFPLDFATLEQRIQLQGHPTLILQSQAETHSLYLQRPDLGRLLNAFSLDTLQQTFLSPADAAIIIADGLSSKAIDQHAEPLMHLLLPEFYRRGYRLTPICLVKHGRVAIGDVIAAFYAARLCIVLIGERPGLSSPDSMGIYFTYQAKTGISTDADRNCISNIHHNGLGYAQAVKKLWFLINEAERLKLSGVSLKDGSADIDLNNQQE